MKTAFITGSSRGIGRAIALRLASDGFKVILHGVTLSDKLKELKNTIEQAGGTADIAAGNLCNMNETQELALKVENADVLVLNASLQYRTPWQEITLPAANEQLNCNFLSSLVLIQSAVSHMKESGWGRIITIGSVQEAKPHPDMLVYSASKAAQTNMMQSLSLQLAKDGITVNNVAPGVIYTDRNKDALADADYAEKVKNSIPVGFYGTPDDCAGIVSLVDGGKSIQ